MADLVTQAIERILDRIADGRFAEGSTLPGEIELANELQVSRLTMREAVRTLKDRGVLGVQHGRGTWVLPRDQWIELSTLVDMTLRTESTREVGLKLTELRRMVEVGCAGLAAERRTPAHLDAMLMMLDAMDATLEAELSVEDVVAADLGFHDAILAASGNPFLGAVLHPLDAALRESRMVTASSPAVRARAQSHHYAIFEAIQAGDCAAAKDAMRAHMDQTREDLIAVTA